MNKNSKIKCNKCNGSGFVPIGPGIRGIKKCPECNRTGIVAYIKKDDTYTDMKIKEAIRICEMAIGKVIDADGNTIHVYNDELRIAIETILRENYRLNQNKLNKEAWRQLAETYKRELDNSISKDKIKEKIMQIKATCSQINGNYFMMNDTIQILEELLKGEI